MREPAGRPQAHHDMLSSLATAGCRYVITQGAPPNSATMNVVEFNVPC